MIVFAPSIWQNCNASRDTPPVPWNSTVSPVLTLPSTTTERYAVSPAHGRVAASMLLK